MLLLNSGDPTPLHSWRLPGDTPTSMRLLLGSGGGPEGVLCLTQRGELLMLSVAGAPSTAAGGGGALIPRPRQRQVRESRSFDFVGERSPRKERVIFFVVLQCHDAVWCWLTCQPRFAEQFFFAGQSAREAAAGAHA